MTNEYCCAGLLYPKKAVGGDAKIYARVRAAIANFWQRYHSTYCKDVNDPIASEHAHAVLQSSFIFEHGGADSSCSDPRLLSSVALTSP